MKGRIFTFNHNDVSLKLSTATAEVGLIQIAQQWVITCFQLPLCVWTQMPHIVHSLISFSLSK